MGILSAFQNLLQDTLQWIDMLGIWGMVIFILVYIIATIFWLPGTLLTLGAGFLYGVVRGSILVSIASTLAATAAFLVGRYLTRDKVIQLIERQPKFKAIDEAVGREGWKIVGLTRLSPLFPFVFLNYAFGLTKISLRDYFLASWLGMMPGTILYVYLGSLTQDLAMLGQNNTSSWGQWTLQIIGFLATLMVTVYITKISQKALTLAVEEVNQKEK